MNKVIRMTEEIWNLPACTGDLHNSGNYCAMGKLALALGMSVPDSELDGPGEVAVWSTMCQLLTSSGNVWQLNDKDPLESINDVRRANPVNHELAIREGIEQLVAQGYILETDDTVSKELARLKACAEVV